MAYILFDAHNFYVSAELVWRPDLLGTPVVVIGSNDGCVISRSQQAKDLGIKMGEPAHFVREEYWRDNVRFFSANFALYGDMSSRMMSVIESLVPQMRPYSIDEAFCICDGMSTSQMNVLALQVQTQVLKWTGLPIGAGIGDTPTLAKVASYLAKRVYRVDMFAIHSEQDRLQALAITPIGEVWGIGPAYAGKLTEMGITTALELASASPALIKRSFPVGVLRTQAELLGTPSVDLGDTGTPRQMIIVGRSFGQNVSTFDEIAPAFSTFALKACEKLTRQKSVCGSVRAFLRPAAGSYARPSAVTCTLSVRTSDPRTISRAAVDCLARMRTDGLEYSKGGICLLDLDQPDSAAQSSLFDTYDVEGDRLASLIAQVQGKFGRGSMSLARTLGPSRWKPKAGGVSDAYTTRISQLKVVN